MHTYEILCFTNAQLIAASSAIALICLAAGLVLGRVLGRRSGHDQGFGEGAEHENQSRREEEHKFRQSLWEDQPAHAAALLIGEIYTHYQPTPLIWKAMGKLILRKQKVYRRRILEVTPPSSPRTRKSK